MAKILCLDTSTKVCSVAIFENDDLIASQSYYLQKSHSALLPIIIEQLLYNAEIPMDEIEAIAVSQGPGSYTGLRIGTATAKGLAFALSIPLIGIDSLDSMLHQVKNNHMVEGVLCAMIDARRMEVYCKMIDMDSVIWQSKPLIVDENSFAEFNKPVYVFGDGAKKVADYLSSDKIRFIPNIHPSAAYMGTMAYGTFLDKNFEDVAYFEPEYLKEFRTNVPSQKFKV